MKPEHRELRCIAADPESPILSGAFRVVSVVGVHLYQAEPPPSGKPTTVLILSDRQENLEPGMKSIEEVGHRKVGEMTFIANKEHSIALQKRGHPGHLLASRELQPDDLIVIYHTPETAVPDREERFERRFFTRFGSDGPTVRAVGPEGLTIVPLTPEEVAALIGEKELSLLREAMRQPPLVVDLAEEQFRVGPEMPWKPQSPELQHDLDR